VRMLEDMALDVRRTIALWVTEGLSVPQMCDVLGVARPDLDTNQLRYVQQRALARWLAMGAADIDHHIGNGG
jgi:hypothetical protein